MHIKGQLNRMHKTPDGQYSWKFRLSLWVLFIICRLLMMTWRVRFVGLDRRRKAIAQNPRGSFALATFHENAAAGVLSHPGQGIGVLCSQSKDGEIVAYLSARVGLRPVRGSSSRGGREARQEMIDILREGISVAVTVDGPRGPRRKPKAGVMDVARRSGAAVIPITCMGEHSWILHKTWDKTRIPKPFTRLIAYYGEPIFIPSDCEGEAFEQICRKVELALEQDDTLILTQFKELWAEGKHFSQ